MNLRPLAPPGSLWTLANACENAFQVRTRAGIAPASGVVTCGGCAGGGCFPPYPSGGVRFQPSPNEPDFPQSRRPKKRRARSSDPILEGVKEVVGTIVPAIVQMGADQRSSEARTARAALYEEEARRRLMIASARLAMGSAIALCPGEFPANAAFRMILDAARMDVETALIELSGDVDLRIARRSTVAPNPATAPAQPVAAPREAAQGRKAKVASDQLYRILVDGEHVADLSVPGLASDLSIQDAARERVANDPAFSEFVPAGRALFSISINRASNTINVRTTLRAADDA